MNYFITGATGFIGRRLVRKLLARPEGTIFFLARKEEAELIETLRSEYWSAGSERVVAIYGDLREDGLGVTKTDLRKIKSKVTHFFHLAAIYDLKASAEIQQKVNVEGTRRVVQFAEELGAKHFHLFSSIASAGMFEGLFREDMFEEAEGLDHPYFSTKHESERIVREECKIPFRIYRPGIVVGDSRTGEMDKIDGPYYFFKLIQRLRNMLPPWMPAVGLEGGRINIVPVNFIVDAVDHISHAKGEDGKCFHLVDPTPYRVGDILNIFARAGHAPQMSIRINAALFYFIPKGIRKAILSLTPVKRVINAVMKDLGLPDEVFTFVNYPTRFDARETQRVLRGSGIEVPRLEDYAWRLWDYWERHLDPDLFVDRTLRGNVKNKVVLVTGGSSGIGKATAYKLAEAGATTAICGRDVEKLEETRKEFQAAGLTVHTYQADVSDEKSCADLVAALNEQFGGVDILVNNAGRSIRRAIENSFDRFHDFERTMQTNYFGALRITMGVLPKMIEKRRGHVINISSIGVLTNAPRFSAYVASKSALDSWTRCAASEFADRGIEFTTINMPLVRTPMIAPTEMYKDVPTLAPEDAADLVIEAIIHKPVRIATRLGIFGQVIHALLPKAAQAIMNTTFRMFPDSTAAQGGTGSGEKKSLSSPTADQVAFSQLMRGIHF